MRSAAKKIIEKTICETLIYTGKRIVDETVIVIKDFWSKRKQNKGTQQAKYTTEESDSMVPSETLDEILSKGISHQASQLAGNFLYKGDTCLICAYPNAGKTILAMQIGLDIAEGKSSKLTIANEEQTFAPQVVYYYDGEQRITDLRHRHRRGTYPKTFFLVKDMNLDSLEKLYRDICRRITKEHPNEDCTVIVDNIACFCENKNTDSVREFCISLNKLKSEFEKRGCNLTVLLVIHTLKTYNKYTPIELNDIAGAAEFSRFANSVIVLEECRLGKDKRILKSLKCKYNSLPEEVSIIGIVEGSELHFEYECSMLEEDALPLKPQREKEKTIHMGTIAPSTQVGVEQFPTTGNQSIIGKVKAGSAKKTNKRKKVTPEMLQRIKKLDAEGKTQGEIAEALGLSRKTVNKYLQCINQEEPQCNLSPLLC